jgi:hypothetical protein
MLSYPLRTSEPGSFLDRKEILFIRKPEAVVQVKDYHMEQEFREQRRMVEYIPI